MGIIAILEKAANIDHEQLKNDAVLINRKLITDLNKDQMSKGLNADNDVIGEYSFSYALLKSKRSDYKAPFGIPNLLDTGSFQNAMDMETTSDNQFFVFSNDPKSEDLTAKYGDNIFGLIPANIIKAKPYVINTYFKLLSKLI